MPDVEVRERRPRASRLAVRGTFRTSSPRPHVEVRAQRIGHGERDPARDASDLVDRHVEIDAAQLLTAGTQIQSQGEIVQHHRTRGRDHLDVAHRERVDRHRRQAGERAVAQPRHGDLFGRLRRRRLRGGVGRCRRERGLRPIGIDPRALQTHHAHHGVVVPQRAQIEVHHRAVDLGDALGVDAPAEVLEFHTPERGPLRADARLSRQCLQPGVETALEQRETRIGDGQHPDHDRHHEHERNGERPPRDA